MSVRANRCQQGSRQGMNTGVCNERRWWWRSGCWILCPMHVGCTSNSYPKRRYQGW